MGRDFFKDLFKSKNWNRSSILVFIGALGLFLLLAGNAFSPGIEKGTTSEVQSTADQTTYAREYADSLEDTLTQVIGSIQGAGQVKVAVTLEAGPQTVYALDETDRGENGSEIQHILLEDSSGQNALVEMVWEPEIRGIAVVCEGAADIQVQAQITEAVSVLTGVSSNRISIAKMNESEGT